MARTSTCVMRESYARRPKRDTARPTSLLVAQRVDWIELGRPLRRKHSEYDADAHRHHHCDDRESEWNGGVDLHRERSEAAQRQSDQDTEHAAEACECRRLDEELKENLSLGGAERLPDANL